MFERSAEHVTEEVTKHSPAIVAEDTTSKEIAGEEVQAKKIVKALKQALKVTDVSLELEKGPWWDPGPIVQVKDILAKFANITHL